MSQSHDDSALSQQLRLAVAFGVVFLLLILLLAVAIPKPTEFQIFVFRVTLSLAAGAIGAIIPGFFQIEGQFLRLSLRAGGALAVFWLVFSVNPPALVVATNPIQNDSSAFPIDHADSVVGRPANTKPKRVSPGVGVEPVMPAQLQSVLPFFSSFLNRTITPRIASFELSERKTSYTEDVSTDRIDDIRRFWIPDNWGPCNSVNDVRVLEGLRRFVTRSGRSRLLQHLTSTNSLNTLAVSGDPILRQIMPRAGDWGRVDAADRDAILTWMRNCVGLFHPVFLITLYNPNNYEVLVPRVRYYVLAADRGEAGGGMFGYSIFPVATYAHTIKAMPGDQRRQVYRPTLSLRGDYGMYDDYPGVRGRLRRDRSGNFLIVPPAARALQNPTPVIPARGHVSFELQIAAEEGGLLADVLMSIEVVTSAGSVRTPEFLVELGTGGG